MRASQVNPVNRWRIRGKRHAKSHKKTGLYYRSAVGEWCQTRQTVFLANSSPTARLERTR